MNDPFAPRLFFVVGKGGVGKSTVAAALAAALAARGARVLLVGLGAPPRDVDGVTTATVDGVAAFAEYLASVLPAGLAGRLAGTRLVRRFVAAAPGLRELMAVGKIAHEERRVEEGAPVWDAVVVDAPATGHALDVLRMPAAAAEAFGGLVRREAERILAALRTPGRTAVWLVSTPEELPVRETIETATELRERLQLPLGALVVNALCQAPLSPDEVPRPPEGAPRLIVDALVCAREEAAWAAQHARFAAALERAVPLPAARLPRLDRPPDGADLRGFGDSLVRQLGGAA